ncbi:MAG: acylphosphatase [Armatimonadota bacterium]
MEKRLRAIVKGKVQGVGYRYYVLDNALSLKLRGFCRNLRNGDVEVVAEGEEGALEALVSFLKRGPAMSRVDEVIEVWQNPKNEFLNFQITSTY